MKMNDLADGGRVELPDIKAVVFDLDGLMFNTEEIFHLTGHELLRRRGIEATPEIFAGMMGRRANEAFQAMIDLTRISDSIDDLKFESEMIFRELMVDRLAPMPGLFELLVTIEDRGLSKAVATSSERKYLHELLGKFDMLSRFDTLLTAEDVTHGKPHPEIYQTAAARLGVATCEMLVLEDSQNGTHAAAAAGAVVVSVPHVHSAHHDFTVAFHVAESLVDPVVLRLVSGR